MSIKITFYDKQLNRQLRTATSSGLQRATVYLHNKCREAVNVPNTGVSVRGSDGRSKRIYPNPSQPGEPPRKRTGWGQRHIVWEFDANKLEGRVGVALAGIYMIYLELGTRLVAPRPWLVSTLQRHARMLGMLATTGGRK